MSHDSLSRRHGHARAGLVVLALGPSFHILPLLVIPCTVSLGAHVPPLCSVALVFGARRAAVAYATRLGALPLALVIVHLYAEL